MLHVVAVVGRAGLERNHEDGDGVVERRAGTEILVGFAGAWDAGIAGFVTGHADIVFKRSGEMAGVDDLCAAPKRGAEMHFADVIGAGAVAVFAADGGLSEGGGQVFARVLSDRIGTAAVAGDAASEDGAVEAEITGLEAG